MGAPASALNVSIWAQILNLLKGLLSAFLLTILFISHRLSVIRQMADDVAVLQAGTLMEAGNSEATFEHPNSDYTRELLSLTPVMPPSWQISVQA